METFLLKAHIYPPTYFKSSVDYLQNIAQYKYLAISYYILLFGEQSQEKKTYVHISEANFQPWRCERVDVAAVSFFFYIHSSLFNFLTTKYVSKTEICFYLVFRHFSDYQFFRRHSLNPDQEGQAKQNDGFPENNNNNNKTQTQTNKLSTQNTVLPNCPPFPCHWCSSPKLSSSSSSVTPLAIIVATASKWLYNWWLWFFHPLVSLLSLTPWGPCVCINITPALCLPCHQCVTFLPLLMTSKSKCLWTFDLKNVQKAKSQSGLRQWSWSSHSRENTHNPFLHSWLLLGFILKQTECSLTKEEFLWLDF